MSRVIAPDATRLGRRSLASHTTSTKWPTSSGMSSRRARSGGSSIGTTASR